MSNLITPQNAQLIAALGAEFVRQQKAEMQAMVKDFCSQVMVNGNGNALVPKAAAAMPPTSGPFGQGYPGQPGMGSCQPFVPSRFNSWCNIKCDPCLYSNLELDVELYAWPLLEPQLYDVDTKLNNLITGALPLVAGASLTMSQETDRTIAYVPDCVQIATTWTGAPQPGLLSYQWQVTTQDNLLTGQAQFANVQNGQQYECGTNCLKVPFPSYKGCSGWPIGSLAALQLVVTLDAAATSVMNGISITVYHRRSKNVNGAQSSCNGVCGIGGGCGGGCGG